MSEPVYEWGKGYVIRNDPPLLHDIDIESLEAVFSEPDVSTSTEEP